MVLDEVVEIILKTDDQILGMDYVGSHVDFAHIVLGCQRCCNIVSQTSLQIPLSFSIFIPYFTPTKHRSQFNLPFILLLILLPIIAKNLTLFLI